MSHQSGKDELSLTVNGKVRTVRAYPMERVLDVLRVQLKLTGAKEGCGEGECGSCAVLLDGVIVNSCLVPIVQAQGAQVVTIEGLGDGEALHELQTAFLQCGGAQCGICTSGMIMAAYQLLQKKLRPTAEEIAEGLAGNLCRCTGYTQICEAVAQAAARRSAASLESAS